MKNIKTLKNTNKIYKNIPFDRSEWTKYISKNKNWRRPVPGELIKLNPNIIE